MVMEHVVEMRRKEGGKRKRRSSTDKPARSILRLRQDGVEECNSGDVPGGRDYHNTVFSS
jgi:hypothetical protein